MRDDVSKSLHFLVFLNELCGTLPDTLFKAAIQALEVFLGRPQGTGVLRDRGDRKSHDNDDRDAADDGRGPHQAKFAFCAVTLDVRRSSAARMIPLKKTLCFIHQRLAAVRADDFGDAGFSTLPLQRNRLIHLRELFGNDRCSLDRLARRRFPPSGVAATG